MKKLCFSGKCSLHSFTLVELLVVMAIIALLLGLSQPALQNAIYNAQSTKCAANLRSIGSAVNLYATDNNNTLPTINQVATVTSGPQVYPAGTPGFLGVLGAYGISSNVIVCPIDAGRGSAADCNNTAYQNPGSSYEWNPVFDDEPVIAPAVYISANNIRPVTPGRIRLAMDYTAIHHGHQNAIFLDGHVSKH